VNREREGKAVVYPLPPCKIQERRKEVGMRCPHIIKKKVKRESQSSTQNLYERKSEGGGRERGYNLYQPEDKRKLGN